ncbi:hypothetical protein RDABS01_024497 [Bienertia sinuspersici]
MAEDLAKELEKFHLTKDENTVVGNDLQEGDDLNTSKKVELMMIGKILTNRPFNFEAMKRTLRSIWRLKEGVAVRMVETNLFAFQFSSSRDKDLVKNGMPWFFDNQLLLLKEVRGDEQLSEITFYQSPVWVRVYDLPFVKRNAQFARCIGENMGGFVDFDDSDPLGLDNFLRIKVMIDVGKPLRRGMKIATSSNCSKWVDIKYERLGDFCYYCGKLGHVDRDCEETMIEEEKKEMVYRYGPWMRASPLKRGKISKEENDKERLIREKLKNKRWGRGMMTAKQSLLSLGPRAMQGENFSTRGMREREQIWRIGKGFIEMKERWRRMSKEGRDNGKASNEGEGCWDSRQNMEKKRWIKEVEGYGESLKKAKCGATPMETDDNHEGLANPDTVNSLRSWCWRDRPNIVFIMETMIDGKRLENIQKKCGYCNGVCVSSNGNSGGMGFWWKDVNIQMKTYSHHHFEAEVLDEGGEVQWRAVGIYGWAEASKKYRTWELIRYLILGSNTPTILFGDFNEILSPSEKEGGASRCPRQMENFRQVVDECSLRDLGYSGNIFTWRRGNSPATIIRERLDRFMATPLWCSLFPEATVVNLHIQNSDHGPIILKEKEGHGKSSRRRRTRFESLWLTNEGCEDVIREAWKESWSMMMDGRIATVLERLDGWAKATFGDVKKRIKVAEKKLEELQSRTPDAWVLEQYFEQGGWNRGLIEHWFNDDEKELILNTPLLGGVTEDRLYWWPCSNGVFTMRSGYWLAKLGHVRSWFNEAHEEERACWKVVWNVFGPPKLCHFVWRACKGALAVMGRLFERHIIDSKTCPICGNQEESIVHTFFSCKYAQEIWSKTEFSSLVSEAPSNSFAERLLWLAGKVKREELTTILTLAWAAWHCRNKEVIEKETPKVDSITRCFVTMVEEYCAHNERTGKTGCGTGRVVSYDRWCSPPNEVVKVNVDAHVSVDGKVGLGAVIRDHRGKIKVAVVHRIKARSKPEVAEARAALYGIQMARRLGFSKVVLECDAMQVVSAITTEAKGASPIFLFYDEINRLKSCFISFSCNHVKRRGNCVAHLVARGEVADGSERVWFDPIPQNYCILADLDLI